MSKKEEITFDEIEAEGRELVKQKWDRRDRILDFVNRILFAILLFIILFGGTYLVGFEAGRTAPTDAQRLEQLQMLVDRLDDDAK